MKSLGVQICNKPIKFGVHLPDSTTFGFAERFPGTWVPLRRLRLKQRRIGERMKSLRTELAPVSQHVFMIRITIQNARGI